MRLPPLLLACSAFAAPPSSLLLSNASGQNQAFAAVGRLHANSSCTAFLIEPESSSPGSPAYALTAGHCVSREPYAVIANQPAGYTIDFNYFADTRDAAVTVGATTVVWSTMKGTDLALLQLDATIGALQARGLRGFRLFPGPLTQGASVFWVGAPAVNFPAERAFLRRGECSALGSTALIEAARLWHDEIRNDCPDVYGGASGSPLFDAASGRVAGVIGTTTNLSSNGGPDFDCFENRPCAVTPSGPAVESDTSYAAPVSPLSGCFDASGLAAPFLPACGLDPGFELAIDVNRRTAAPPRTNGELTRWDARLSGTLPYYAYKTVRLGLDDCRNPAGYSKPILLSFSPTIFDPIGRQEGHYLLCVVAGSTPSIGASWQSFDFPSLRRMRVDALPPALPPGFEVDPADDGYRLTVSSVPPAVSSLQYKAGHPFSTDCTSPAAYRPYLAAPIFVPRSAFPQRLCLRYADDAGNAAPPLVFFFNTPVIQPFGLRNGASLERTLTLSPGSLFRLDGIELTAHGEPRLELTDASGRTRVLPLAGLQPVFLEARIPEDTPSGRARLELRPPVGLPSALDIDIAPSAPGLFRADFSSSGPPLGYFASPTLPASPLAQCQPGSVSCAFLSVPAGAEETDVVLFGTGLPRDLASVSLGTETVHVVSSGPVPAWPGLDELRLRLPPYFPLRGYQRLQAGGASVWLLLAWQ